jgi:hypothetical protein
MKTATAARVINHTTLLATAAHIEAAASAVAKREVTAQRLLLLLRDIGRVDTTLLSTCEAALPAECGAGETDVRGSIAIARQKLSEVFADAERLQD